jgi:hypothetical protein
MTNQDDLSSLLGNLALKEKGQEVDAKSQKLQREINRAGFRIFECLSDNGYFSWSVPMKAPTKTLGSMKTKNELKLTDYLDLDGKPDQLVDPRSIKTPKAFLSLSPRELPNRFPHGKLDIVCFHVAARYRGIDFADIDFAFGGSTLEMLATFDANDPFMVTFLPGTKTIVIVKCKDYIKNLSDIGFQFERLMTGTSMAHVGLVSSNVEHLHVMNVGTYRVFFRAETDAMQGEGPVEIKASNPRYWGSKVLFQMISNGSTTLCHGMKGRGSLIGVELQTLEQVARTALGGGRRAQVLEDNILRGMDSIKSQMKDASAGDVFKVHFQGSSLKLLPARGRSADILPPADVVGELISGFSK